MLILNLKTYEQTSGTQVSKIFTMLEQLAEKDRTVRENVYITPAMVDLSYCTVDFPKINIIAQHVDALEIGKTTGYTPANLVKNLGINTTLLNHSEKRLGKNLISHISFIQQVGMKAIVCCEDLEEVKDVLQIQPYAIAYESKELIGSGRGVSQEEPGIVKEFVEICNKKTLPIIGAGISTKEDIEAGLKFGAKGFLVASRFAKAEDKKEKLLELLEPFRK